MNNFKKLGFLASHFLVILSVVGYYFHSHNWVFFATIYAYGLVPILDEVVGKDYQNVQKEQFEALLNDKFYDIAVYSHVYLQYFMLGWVSYILVFDGLTTFQMIGAIISQGVYASSIINVAHELGHRQHPLAQIHARLALISVSYMHFVIEHNRGHHVHVATPLDPATAKKNQTIFSFWKQTLVGSFRSAWQIEQKRLEKQGKNPNGIQNEMYRVILFPILLCTIMTLTMSFLSGRFEWIIPVFFIVQSVIAILSLECVNYIEHYGITRREVSEGRYERVNPLHSWNANHLYSNLMLFHLQRHSDHHAFASRPYQVLRHFDESPQLPFGYPIMLLMSLCPPLWFRVMNKRLEEWQKNAYDAEHITKVVKQFV
ncbi:MAG: alkane 1-monooxygenase [Spirosomataceae bacterium]